MLNLYLNGLVKWRWGVIVITLILVGVLSSGARFLGFTNDYRIFFSDDNPDLIALETLENTYTKDDTVLFVISPKKGKVFTRRTLESIAWLTEQSWSIPYVQRVDSLKNFQYSYGKNDELIVHDLFKDPASYSAGDFDKTKSRALNEPLLRNRLISENADVTGVSIIIRLPGLDEEKETPEVASYVRKLAQELTQNNPELTVRLTGGLIIDNAFSEASQHDFETLVPIMFLLVLITLAALLRSLSGTIWVLITITFAIVMTMGTAGWLGFKLSAPSSIAPNIILTIAIADCVHLLVSFLHSMRSGWINRLTWKEQRIKAAKEALTINLQPIFLTSLTTALGFLSLNYSDSPPFHDLGNIVAIGVGFAFFLSIVFLPTLMMVMPIKTKPYKTHEARIMDRFAEWVIRQRTPLLIGSTIVIIFLASAVPKNELNDDIIKYFSTESTIRMDTQYTVNHLTGTDVVEYDIRAESAGGINDPLYLHVLDQFASWYRAQPETIHVYTLADILKRLNKNMHDEAAEKYRIPDSRELAAQYLLLYEMSLPEGLDLTDRVNVNKSASRFTVTTKPLSSNELIALEKRAKTWLIKNAPSYMQAKATSANIIFSHIGESNIRGMLTGTTIALGLISLILIFALRSLSMGLLSLLPNLVPAAAAFGVWALIDGQVNLGLSVVTSLTLGIVVDDTIHFLSKYLKARREMGLSPEGAIKFSFSTVGTALWVTSLVLIIGFLLLSFSDFDLNAKLGLMTALTILFAISADFLFLPPLLLLLDRKK
jgi:predicted RND superfamily exporter protein